MTPLSDAQFALVQRFCQLMSDKIAAIGLDVFVESDFREYIRIRQRLCPSALHNPTFDPDHSHLSLHNAFWLRATDPQGRTAAFIAQRLLESECFLDDILSLRLWHDRSEIDPQHHLGAVDWPAAATLSGRIGHSGGLWIDPTWRKQNLSGLLDHLSRGLLLMNYAFDHITAVILRELAATGIGTRQYGWPRVEGRIDFDLLARGRMWQLVCCQMPRTEVIRRMQAWVIAPEANSIEELQKVGEILAHGGDEQLGHSTAVA